MSEGLPESEEPVDDLDEASEVIPFTYSITAYGADYPVDSIVKRSETEDIVVPRFSWEADEESEIVGFHIGAPHRGIGAGRARDHALVGGARKSECVGADG